jgi:thymidylate synthase ThyX
MKVKIIADSYNEDFDSRVTTFELEYPRFIHAELMTHRLFSRNAASSRAIPVQAVIDMIKVQPAMPVHWGANQPGMQAKGEVKDTEAARLSWIAAANTAVSHAQVMKDMGLHKQVVNRILEPYQMMKTVVTSTCFNNWFWLRNHEDADPTIKALASEMLDAFNESLPSNLFKNEWHLPYVFSARDMVVGEQIFLDDKLERISLDMAKMISASCCAQVSYRKNDASTEKAEMVYGRLIESEPVHASPVEHQCSPIMYTFNPMDYFDIEGVTSVDKNRTPWSGNFHGWIQMRQLIKNNSKVY